LSFFLVGGQVDPIDKNIAESRTKLAEHRYPAFYRQMPQRGREYLEKADIRAMVRWLDSLDQQ
jgi:hypothetical protein